MPSNLGKILCWHDGTSIGKLPFAAYGISSPRNRLHFIRVLCHKWEIPTRRTYVHQVRSTYPPFTLHPRLMRLIFASVCPLHSTYAKRFIQRFYTSVPGATPGKSVSSTLGRPCFVGILPSPPHSVLRKSPVFKCFEAHKPLNIISISTRMAWVPSAWGTSKVGGILRLKECSRFVCQRVPGGPVSTMLKPPRKWR